MSSPPTAKSPTRAEAARTPSSPGAEKQTPVAATQLTANASGVLPAEYWEQQDLTADDNDSTYDGDNASSTASISSSILEYRTIHGRTFHSDNTSAAYWGPNDERQNEAMDIIHHILTVVLDGELYRAPLDKKKLKKVLDIGTGTGTWAIDFADAHPDTEVIGTDVSPIQPGWTPPNLYFEIEDATQPWTFRRNDFDFVHIRYLFGSIGDWDELFKQAYRVVKPGGWIQSYEADAMVLSDDGTVVEGSPLDQWGKIFIEAGKKTGRTFLTIDEDVQRKGLEAAGFTNIVSKDFKVPMSGWPADPKLKELGELTRMALEQDLEGFCLFLADQILGWSIPQIHVYLAFLRRDLRNKNLHPIFRLRCVYAQKPEEDVSSASSSS